MTGPEPGGAGACALAIAAKENENAAASASEARPGQAMGDLLIPVTPSSPYLRSWRPNVSRIARFFLSYACFTAARGQSSGEPEAPSYRRGRGAERGLWRQLSGKKTGGRSPSASRRERRCFLPAPRARDWTPRMKSASARRRGGRGRLPREHEPPTARRGTRRGREQRDRVGVKRSSHDVRRASLFHDATAVEDGDSIAEARDDREIVR